MSGKSKLGCKTCRSRKIKCDETMPICRRCSTTGRFCDGPFQKKFVYVRSNKHQSGAVQHVGSAPLFSSCSFIPGLDAAEVLSFDHFIHRVAPVLSGSLDAAFWGNLLPQMSHENRAIRDAVLAISQLYEQPPAHPGAPATTQSQTHRSALTFYTRSISGFNSSMANPQNSANRLLVLLSCILFTTIEFQQNNVWNACTLLRCGLSMIKADYRRNKEGFLPPDSTSECIRQMFARQRNLMVMCGHDPAPDDHEMCVILASHSGPRDCSLITAREELFDCLYDGTHFLQVAMIAAVHSMNLPDDHLLTQQALVLSNLKTWHRKYSQLWQISHTQNTLQEDLATSLLLLYYETALCWITIALKSEAATDEYVEHFERIILLSEKVGQQRQRLGSPSVPFSFELGTIAPLWLTGSKCRDPILRRKALKLLRQGSEQEALLSAQLYARALEKVIDIEENGIAISTTCQTDGNGWLPPRQSRIQNCTIHYETWGGVKVTPAIICDIESYNTNGEPISVQETFLL